MTVDLSDEEVFFLKYVIRREAIELEKKRARLILKFGGVANLAPVEEKLKLTSDLRDKLR